MTTPAKRLVVEELELDPGTVMVFREFDDKTRAAYDPDQIPAELRPVVEKVVRAVVGAPDPGPALTEFLRLFHERLAADEGEQRAEGER